MKHKFLLAGLMLLLSLSLFAQTSGTCGDNLTWKLSDGVLTIIGTGKMTDFGDCTPWHLKREKINSITISYGVTSIGRDAFSGCSSLTSVTIPNSVTSIGNYAFDGCCGLTSITIPNSVTSIGDYAFYGCSSLPVIDNIRYADTYLIEAVDKTLSTYTIKDRTKWIGNQAFSGCSSLTSIEIPNSVTNIDKGAFSGCSGLTSVTIPNSVTSIGSGAFQDCSSLTSVTISNSLKYIDTDAFLCCSSLTSIVIPNSVTSIGWAAFARCSSLTSIVIPNSVTSIGGKAFDDCSSLTSVEIPNSVIEIGREAFHNCSSLTSVTIPNSITEIRTGVFKGCSSLTSIEIPNSVTSIGNYAFNECNRLKNVTIGASVSNIGDYAFAKCTNFDWIICYASEVPTITSSTFEDIGNMKYIYLYVPADRQRAYLRDKFWGEFDVQPIESKATETEEVTVTPTETTADIVWPTVTGAASYELVIRYQNGDIICTLVFNSKGQLTSITFNAPSRDNAPDDVQTAGFSFTVSGLDAGTTYNYTLTAKDSGGNTLDTRTGSFKTAGTATGVEESAGGDVVGTPSPRKVMRDGVMYILMPDGRMYDVKGAEVK